MTKKPHGIAPVVEAKAPEHIQRVNPFLPHDPALFVEDASEHHKILLNKFCIVPHHFLIVTKGNLLSFHRSETHEKKIASWWYFPTNAR